MRIPADGGTSVRLKNVFFVKNAVGEPFYFDAVNGKQIPILQWENVRWVTISNNKMILGDLIPKPY